MRFFSLGLIFRWPSLSFYSPFMLEEWFIVTYYLYLTLISILERKRDLCARMVSEKEQDVLLCFLLWGKQVLSIIGKGHRECYLRAHSLHLPWSIIATQLQPQLLVRNVSEPSVGRPLIFFWIIMWNFMVLKCPSLIQIKREKKHSTDQMKRIRGLPFSATEERRLSAL